MFVLRLADETQLLLQEPPVVVFAMHPELTDPASAVVVTPSKSGAEAEIRDVLEPDSSYTAPLSHAGLAQIAREDNSRHRPD